MLQSYSCLLKLNRRIVWQFQGEENKHNSIVCGWISMEGSLLCYGQHLAACQCLYGELGIHYLYSLDLIYKRERQVQKLLKSGWSHRDCLDYFREDSVTNSHSSLGWHNTVICFHHMFIILNSLGENKQKLCLLLEGPIGNIILGRKFRWWTVSLSTSIKPRQ